MTGRTMAGEWRSVIQDISVNTSSSPREMFLIKGLLKNSEVDQILEGVLKEDMDMDCTHAHILVEDGQVVSPEIFKALEPAVEERILPFVRKKYEAPGIVVADALIRAYLPDNGRQSLPLHFDVSSFATVIVPLNPGNYEGGLFIQGGASASKELVDRDCDKGDIVVHK